MKRNYEIVNQHLIEMLSLVVFVFFVFGKISFQPQNVIGSKSFLFYLPDFQATSLRNCVFHFRDNG